MLNSVMQFNHLITDTAILDHVSATNFAFNIHHTWTVSEQTKDNTISLGLWDVTWHFRDCLGH